jgi:hypothetical protein
LPLLCHFFGLRWFACFPRCDNKYSRAKKARVLILAPEGYERKLTAAENADGGSAFFSTDLTCAAVNLGHRPRLKHLWAEALVTGEGAQIPPTILRGICKQTLALAEKSTEN